MYENNMPRLLILNSSKNYGSTGKIAEQIGLLAKSRGWEVKFAHSERYKRNSDIESLTSGIFWEERIHALLALCLDKQGLYSKHATYKLIEAIKYYNPDVIHIHNIHGYYLNYPILFKYIIQAEIPVVWTMHDCWSFTGHCTYFDIIGCEKWKNHCKKCKNLSGYPKSLIDRSYRNFKEKQSLFTQLKKIIMVPVSEWLGNLTRQSFMGKYPIKVIHNGVDLSVFRMKSTSLRQKLNLEDKFIVLGVSSNGFSGRKGLNDFIRLANELPKQFQIIMIGLKKSELEKIPTNIIGLQRTSNVENLVDFYNEADVFINPTYSDNFPTTNIEALACGTPVITYKTGGSPEAVDQNTGYVIEQGDLTALVKLIISLRGKEKPRMQCRNRAVNLFDKNKCFDEYIAAYNSFFK